MANYFKQYKLKAGNNSRQGTTHSREQLTAENNSQQGTTHSREQLKAANNSRQGTAQGREQLTAGNNSQQGTIHSREQLKAANSVYKSIHIYVCLHRWPHLTHISTLNGTSESTDGKKICSPHTFTHWHCTVVTG